MSQRIRVSWWVGFAALLLMMPLAFGQNQVDLVLQNGGNYTMDGVYVGPYNATQSVNNGPAQNVQIICDDFKDEVVPGESWTANVVSFSTLANTGSTAGLMFNGDTAGGALLNNVSGTALQGYVAMAYLASQMLPLSGNPGNAQQVGYLAYAIWAIFEPTLVQNWLGAGSQAWLCVEKLAQGALSGALNNTYTAASFAGWEILSPVPGSQNPGSLGTPQEYFMFVPEGGTALMYLLLAGFACFGTMYFKARRHATSETV